MDQIYTTNRLEELIESIKNNIPEKGMSERILYLQKLENTLNSLIKPEEYIQIEDSPF